MYLILSFLSMKSCVKIILLGVKGAGEAGAISAPPAVINAVCNALCVNHIDMPAKPEKIWKCIKKKTNLISEHLSESFIP